MKLIFVNNNRHQYPQGLTWVLTGVYPTSSRITVFLYGHAHLQIT
jgi:hypothetical protein